MLSERVHEEIDWEDRRVRTDTLPSKAEQEEADDESEEDFRPALIDPERSEQLAQQLNDAERAVNRLEKEAREAVDDAMNGDLGNRPATQEALQYLAGTHPDYESETGGVPDEDKLDEDEELTGAAVGRAYDVLEHADRNALGIDLKEEIGPESAEDQKMERFEPISSPAEAAGDRDPDKRGIKKTAGEVTEAAQREDQAGFGKKAFWLIGAFAFKALAMIVRNIARKIENALNITIPVVGFTIPLGKYIAIPIHALADALMSISERLMEKALGYDPTPARPSDADFDPPDDADPVDSTDLFGDEGPQDGDGNRISMNDIVNAEPETGPDAGGMGKRILQAGQRVLKTSEEKAQEKEDSDLQRALKRYDNARTLKRDVQTHKEVATAWGVGADQIEGPGQEPNVTDETTPVAQDEGPLEKC